MKKLLLLASTLFLASPVVASEITNRITDSVQLTVDGPALQTTRLGSSYSVSGSNISVSTLGGLRRPTQITRELNTGVDTDPLDIQLGTYAIDDDGSAFTFSETAMVGDNPITDQTAVSTSGRVSEPVLYGDSITTLGGTAGTLAGQLSASGAVPTVTAGGPGSTAIGQRTIELTVFQ